MRLQLIAPHRGHQRSNPPYEIGLINAAWRDRLKLNYHIAIFVLLIAGFLFVAAQRLGTVPVPETDEAFTLQVPYEIFNRGQLSLPMYRLLGGNIENVWHSFTPLYFALLSAFFKLFGFGLAQGRAFNLITAALVLLITYVIGRRLFDWPVGIIAVALLISDLTFLERSRILRNDYAAAFLAMLAYYLFETARKRKRGWLYAASGLAAGAGVMCHTNILYMFGAIGMLMLVEDRARVFLDRKLYQFVGSAFLVMAYEIIYDLIDFKNFLLQNRKDSQHFSLFEEGGIWRNVVGELGRYHSWHTAKAKHYGILYGLMTPEMPRTLIHIFELLTVIAGLYLLIAVIRRRARRTKAIPDPGVRLLVVTVFAVLFHAVITGDKEVYYMAHLAPWFGLCVGVMLWQALKGLRRWRPGTEWINEVTIALAGLAIAAFGLLLARQAVCYYRAVRNPELVGFEEYKTALREIVPEGVCPVSKRSPVIWLAFPESDRCFATIEGRMRKELDIFGKEYALVVPEGPEAEIRRGSHHLLGELKGTVYGMTLRIYYTGNDPRYLALEPKYYNFFGWQRGHYTDELSARAQESRPDMGRPDTDR